jgi:putative Mg2+ transporter-C (MgtC) family protein
MSFHNLAPRRWTISARRDTFADMHWVASIIEIDQHITQWAASLGGPLEALLRLFLAAMAGGVVGLEREVRGRQAGFRTYLLVCLGSAIVMLVSAQVALHPWVAASEHYTIRVDPGRIAYGVMTGVGFLGAGVIVKGTSGGVRGLTTAAGLWCIAAVGLALGLGLYMVAVMGTTLVVASLWILDYLEDFLPKLRYRNVIIRRKWEVGCIAATIQRFRDANLRVTDASFERTSDLEEVDVNLRIVFVNKKQYYNFERQMEGDTIYQLIATREG